MKIFVSYRRSDSRAWAERICDKLIHSFGQGAVFKDLDSIEPGQNFKARLTDALTASEVLLTIVGPQWLATQGQSLQSRLHNVEDFVRLEIETAMAYQIPIIPILIDGATLPKKSDLPVSIHSLLNFQAVEVRGDPNFHNDIGRLLNLITARSFEKIAAEADKEADSQKKGIPMSLSLLDHFTDEIKRNPTRFDTYIKRAQYNLVLATQPGGKGFKAALADYNLAKKLRHTSSDPHFGLGTTYYHLAFWDIVHRRNYEIVRAGKIRLNQETGGLEMIPPDLMLNIDDRSKAYFRLSLDEFETGYRLQQEYVIDEIATHVFFATMDIQRRINSLRELLDLAPRQGMDEWMFQVFSAAVARGDALAFEKVFEAADPNLRSGSFSICSGGIDGCKNNTLFNCSDNVSSVAV